MDLRHDSSVNVTVISFRKKKGFTPTKKETTSASSLTQNPKHNDYQRDFQLVLYSNKFRFFAIDGWTERKFCRKSLSI